MMSFLNPYLMWIKLGLLAAIVSAVAFIYVRGEVRLHGAERLAGDLVKETANTNRALDAAKANEQALEAFKAEQARNQALVADMQVRLAEKPKQITKIREVVRHAPASSCPVPDRVRLFFDELRGDPAKGSGDAGQGRTSQAPGRTAERVSR